MALSWKPVRDGDVYCAPACGHKCKHRDYLKAKESAEKLAAELGNTWIPIVRENLGWYWSVESPCRQMTVSNGTSYIAIFNRRWIGHGSTAREAVKDALSLAKKELASIQEVIDIFEGRPQP